MDHTLANILMIVGAAAWLAGELLGVFSKGDQTDTATGWIRLAEMKWPIVRVLVGVFVISLFFHLLYGTWLLP